MMTMTKETTYLWHKHGERSIHSQAASSYLYTSSTLTGYNFFPKKLWKPHAKQRIEEG